jgi:hypothetical protein
MEITTISDFRRAIRNGPYAWPGGYPLYFVMADSEALSFKAAKAARRNIIEAISDKHKGYPNNGWLPYAVDVNWEDGELYCSDTNERIESAYAEPEDEIAA